MSSEIILDGILDGSIDKSVVINAIESSTKIKHGECCVCLSEFIPYFLEYLHEKLLPSSANSKQNRLYYSPKQKETKKIQASRQKSKNGDLENEKHKKPSARISLKYASSSPAKNYNSKPPHKNNSLNGISPIKRLNKSDTTTSRRQKTTVLRSQSSYDNSSVFELGSFDDFPSMSSVASTPNQKNPRRITATPVSFGKSVLKLSSTQDAFLGESNFETSCNKDTALNHLLSDDKRFSKTTNNNTEEIFQNAFDCPFNNDFDDAFKRLNVTNNQNNLSKSANSISVIKELKHVLSIKDVLNPSSIDSLVSIYYTIFCRNIISNYTIEFNFLFTVLTIPENNNTSKFSFPFSNVAGCIYFATQCLLNLKNVLILLDLKTNTLLLDNERLRHFTNIEFIEFIESNLNINQHLNKSLHQQSIKSPMTGIPFQAEFDNRKSFHSDQLFHLFSKKRDLFYALVRLWEENHLDPDWNMKDTLNRKVPEIVKTQGDLNVFYPLARLFVAQLIEMCRNNVGSKADETKTNISDNVLLELKTKNPSKFQNLQNRFTRPSITYDPCPKPSFSMVEDFFKEFIFIADSYCFSKYLIHVIMSHITNVNSKSFGLNHSYQLNKSDFAESTWLDIKSAISELRLLAKFLGFIIFLPYKCCVQNNLAVIQESRIYTTEPIDMCVYINKAIEEKRLLITIPWIVDFFSMADQNVFHVEVFKKPLIDLIKLYRQKKIFSEQFSILHLLLIIQIGWLLEQPQLQTLDFYKISLLSDSTFNSAADNNGTGIDDFVNIDKEFLYDICPFLNDIKKPLLDYAKGIGTSSNGSYRKITAVKTSDVFFNDSVLNLRVQLIDSFLKYLPSHVTDCLTFITERHYNNIRTHFTTKIFPICAKQVMEEIKEKLSVDFDSSEEINVDTIKLHNQPMYIQCLTKSEIDVSNQSHLYLKSYLKEKTLASVKSLLPESTIDQIKETSAKVVQHNVRVKMQEWFNANKELYTNSVETLYQRYIKSVIKSSIDHDRSLKYMNCI